MSMCPYIDDQLIDDRPSFFNILSLINLYKRIKNHLIDNIHLLDIGLHINVHFNLIFHKIIDYARNYFSRPYTTGFI